MAVVSFSEAARLCGHKSRSQLYRARDAGDLRAYLIPPIREGGPPLLETHPSGALPLPDHIRRITRTQSNSPTLRADELAQRRAELAQRRGWELAAGALSDALAAAGVPLQLAGDEARAIAAALPEALSDALGVPELEQLAAVVQQNINRLQPPPDPADRLRIAPDGSPGFWVEYGRIAGLDEPRLTPAELYHHAYRMVSGLWGEPPCPERQFADLVWMIDDSFADVAAGARWDQEQWRRGTVRGLLAELPCPLSEAELAAMVAAGTVPSELLESVREALAGG